MNEKSMRNTGGHAVLVVLVFISILLACNFPGMARESISGTETSMPEAGLTIVFPTSTSSATSTNTPEARSTESTGDEEDCTQRAAFVADVTIPDDTVLEKSEEFVKTWRIRNSGTCRWESGVIFTFLSGDKLNAAESVSVPVTEPGEEIEISVEMAAPPETGEYRSNWQMKNAEGTRFGGVFYVHINVEDAGAAEPEEESWSPPERFIGHTSQNCKQVSFTWKDASGETAYLVRGATISETLAADSTTYVWQNPLTGTSLITLTVKGKDDSVLAQLKTTVNVNCGAERPNLVVKKMSFDPKDPVAYLPLTLTLEIKNEGTVDSGAFISRWWKITTLPKESCEWYVNQGLRAGESVKLSCNVDPYSSVNDFVIRGDVDVTQAVVESDEVDNTIDDKKTVIAPSVRYDLVDKAPSATWTAGTPDQALNWPGEDTDSQGYVRWITGEIEDGQFISTSCLQTHPRWQEDGWVQGAYANMLVEGYKVKAGDLFYTNLAFLKGAIEGDVTYKVMIQPEGANPQWIAELAHRYGQGIKTLQVDLTPYAGQKAFFVLKVSAGANANYDWACWLKAVIYGYP